MGESRVIKSQVLCFSFLSPLLLLLEVLNVLGDSRKPHAGSLESRSDLPPDPLYGTNWGYKITDFVFRLLSPLLLLYRF